MSDIVVREAEIDDLVPLRELLTYLHGGEPWDETEHEAAVSALQKIVSDPRRALLLGLCDGRAAGTIDIGVSVNLTRHVSPFAVIENVVVRPELRRRGVGRQLMEAALAFARHQGCYKVQLVSANKRDAAHHLYAAMGFDAEVSGYRRYLAAVD